MAFIWHCVPRGEMMSAKVSFDDMEVEQQALYIIDNYADIFLDNLGLGLNRRRILSIMYEARKRLMRGTQLLRPGEGADLPAGNLPSGPGSGDRHLQLPEAAGKEEAETTAALKAEQHFEMGNYRLALVYYQLLEDESGEGPASERVQECLALIDK